MYAVCHESGVKTYTIIFPDTLNSRIVWSKN